MLVSSAEGERGGELIDLEKHEGRQGGFYLLVTVVVSVVVVVVDAKIVLEVNSVIVEIAGGWTIKEVTVVLVVIMPVDVACGNVVVLV